MNTIQLTKEQRNVIAEFVFSYKTDVLIISDAEDLIKVLADCKLISNKKELLKKVEDKTDGIADELFNLLTAKISKEQIEEIMKEYYGG
jgi:hypothetical protein